MKFFTCPLLLCAIAGAVSVSVTPIEKVLEMLGTMLDKSKRAQHEEVLQWTAYKQFCSDSEKEKQDLVKRADAQIDMLHGKIEKETAEIARLAKEIEGHEADAEKYAMERENATKTRKEEKVDYEKLYTDYSESIVAITQAMKVLKEQGYTRAQAASLLQVVAAGRRVPAEARKALTAFIAEDPLERDGAEMLAQSAPEAAGYEFQSSGIIDILQELKDKFTGERHTLERDEMEQQHAHDMLVLDLTNQIAASKNEIEKKTQAKAETTEDLADDQAQLADTSSARAADAKYLEDLDATCNLKMVDFGSRQKLRSEEVAALEKAITIISSEKVSGSAEQHLRTSSAPASATSFAQLRVAEGAIGSRAAAAAYLHAAAQRLGSTVLAAVATRARDDPFSKVKKLIQDLIDRLTAQEKEEADHKSWCDGELSSNKQTRTDKTTEVETLQSKIDGLNSDIAVLEKDIASLSKAVAELLAAMAKATTLYEAERATNEDTLADAVAGEEGISQAITILQDFYGKAEQSTVLLQQKPEIFEAPYKGLQKDNDNVIAFLQVIHSDFARLESETSKAMAAAQSEYESFMSDSNADKELKNTEIATKNSDLLAKQQDLQDSSDDLTAAQAQLDAALAYYDKLKPSCIGGTRFSDYKERVGRREEEIASLEEALKILSGETFVDSGPTPVYSSVDGGNLGWDTGIQAGSKAL